MPFSRHARRSRQAGTLSSSGTACAYAFGFRAVLDVTFIRGRIHPRAPWCTVSVRAAGVLPEAVFPFQRFPADARLPLAEASYQVHRELSRPGQRPHRAHAESPWHGRSGTFRCTSDTFYLWFDMPELYAAFWKPSACQKDRDNCIRSGPCRRPQQQAAPLPPPGPRCPQHLSR